MNSARGSRSRSGPVRLPSQHRESLAGRLHHIQTLARQGRDERVDRAVIADLAEHPRGRLVQDCVPATEALHERPHGARADPRLQRSTRTEHSDKNLRRGCPGLTIWSPQSDG